MTNDFYCDEVLSGKLPVEVVYETEQVLAFHHTQPTWQVHIVIIPKEHIATLHDVQNGFIFQEVFVAVQSIIAQLKLHTTNYKVIVNGGSYQSSMHLHFHLVSGEPLDRSSLAQSGELMV